MTKARMGEAQQVLADLLQIETDECVIWPFAKVKKGYGVVNAPAPDGRLFRVHRVACERHYGPCPEGREAAHSCGVRACLNYRHLRWATRIENLQDRIRHGGTRLTEADVLTIRRRIETGEAQVRLIEEYDVGQSTISHIATRRHWSWVA